MPFYSNATVQKEQSLLEQKQLLFHKLANVLDDACADDDDDSSGKRKREEDEVKVEAKDEDEKGKKKKAKKEKYLGPKRATTAYALFCKDSFAKGKEIGIQEVKTASNWGVGEREGGILRVCLAPPVMFLFFV